MRGDKEIAAEVFSNHGLPALAIDGAWASFDIRRLDTDSPFRSYDAACAIAGAIGEALGDYPPISVGGAAILLGWHKHETGRQPSKAWPYLESRGWHAAKRFNNGKG